MFAGHLAVALGARKLDPQVPLGALVAATYGLDLLWPNGPKVGLGAHWADRHRDLRNSAGECAALTSGNASR
jgi:hypothetical protein